MELIRSVCTTLFFPDSRNNIDSFKKMADFLSTKGIDAIEFYYDGSERKKIGKILDNTGLYGVYIAVIPSKEKELHLCDLEETSRMAAVRLFKDCIDEAQDNGIKEVMINSGRIGNDSGKGLEALGESVEELFNHIQKKHYCMKLLMEPCDSGIDAFQLIGPYHRSLDFVADMREKGLPLELTMDSAHTVEEGENFLEALKAVRGFCNQIHFANCYIENPKDPLYGDKHLGFEYSNTEWPPSELFKLFQELTHLYAGEESLRIGLEVLCRKDDPYAYFENTWRELSFLHENNRRL